MNLGKLNQLNLWSEISAKPEYSLLSTIYAELGLCFEPKPWFSGDQFPCKGWVELRNRGSHRTNVFASHMMEILVTLLPMEPFIHGVAFSQNEWV